MTITSVPSPAIVAGSDVFDRQVFQAGGTWVKPTGAQTVRVQLVAGGNGGGSGRRGATGAIKSGGGGGAAGQYVDQWYQADFLPASVVIGVGTGGAGGASIGTDDTSGNPGATGGSTTFGSILTAFGPPLQTQGGNITAASGPGQNPSEWSRPQDVLVPLSPGIQAGGNVPGVGGSSNSQQSTADVADPVHNMGLDQPCGGGGGGYSTGVLGSGQLTGGQGLTNLRMDDGARHQVAVAPGGTGAGVVPISSPKQLTDVLYGCIPYYSGAGGGGPAFSATGPGGTGGAGGDAQGYGAGGGGGGPSTNTFPSGTGGAGAPGLAIITSYG